MERRCHTGPPVIPVSTTESSSCASLLKGQRILNADPRVIQSDLVIYPSYITWFASSHPELPICPSPARPPLGTSKSALRVCEPASASWENSLEIAERSSSGDKPVTARRPLPRSRPAPRALSGCRSTPPQVTPTAGHALSLGPPRHARHAGPASQPGVGRGRADASRASTYALQRLSPRPRRAHPGRGSGRPRPRLISPNP